MVDVARVLPRTAFAPEVLRVALEALGRGQRVVVATVVARHGSTPSTPGQKLALVASNDGEGDASLSAVGTIGGGAVERVVLAAMAEALVDPESEPRLDTFRLGASLGMCCGGSVEILIEPMRPAVHVLLIGAGHVGITLAPLLATLGFAVTLCDAREQATDPSRLAALAGITPPSEAANDAGRAPLPGIRVVHAEHDDPEVLSGFAGDPGRAAALVMTHDHKIDQAAIEWALEHGFGFVGGVGSRAKAAKTRARLRAKSAREADVVRVRMPIGFEIGARSPAEIAVSIAAELVAWRAGRSLAQSSDTDTAAQAAIDARQGADVAHS